MRKYWCKTSYYRVVGDVSRKFLNSSGLHHITASASNWAPRPKNFWLKIRWGTEGREGEGGEIFFPLFTYNILVLFNVNASFPIFTPESWLMIIWNISLSTPLSVGAKITGARCEW